MLRQSKGARQYNERITLTLATATVDDYGHVSLGDPTPVLDVYAKVRQMSQAKTALTFQVADVVGLEIEFREVSVRYNGLTWRGHNINFSRPESVDDRGRITRLTGYFQEDNPKV